MKTGLQILTLVVLFSAALTGYADDDHDRAKKLLDAGDILPLESILIKARERQPGKILVKSSAIRPPFPQTGGAGAYRLCA